MSAYLHYSIIWAIKTLVKKTCHSFPSTLSAIITTTTKSIPKPILSPLSPQYLVRPQTPCGAQEKVIINADNDDDNDCCVDIAQSLLMQTDKKKKPTSSQHNTCRAICHRGKDSCNHPSCLSGPSVFPSLCIGTGPGSFILIVAYLLNWQSQKRTLQTKHGLDNEPQFWQ